MTGMPGIDVTALSILPAFDRDLAARDVSLWLAGINERPLALLRAHRPMPACTTGSTRIARRRFSGWP